MLKVNSRTWLSNFPAWLVADVYHRCKSKGWVSRQFMKSIQSLSRKAEFELNSALNYFGLRYYAYNPVAVGF